MLPFVGVDGEGANDSTGRHQYTMLRVGDRYITSRWLDFLASQPKKRIYVAYFFDYDVTMMLRDFPEDDIRTLLATGQVYLDRYVLKYRPRKEFVVRARGAQTTINDVGTFFQCSFLKAIQRWQIGTPEQHAIIESGKTQRSEFANLSDQIVEYNDMECRLLVQLMDKFRSACSAIGYMPRAWQGPGQLAKAMMQKHGVPKTDDIPEFNLAGIWEAAQSAYYGGRFETSAVGPVAGPIDAWDIGSAYPFATTLLPCLSHLSWRPSKEITPMGIYRVRYDHPAQTWYTLPHRRSDGSICYPRRGGGWYWGVELLAAMAMGARITLRYGFEWTPRCDHKLFDFMYRLFSVRKAIGKSEAGMALKLAMNSVYGVTAQSVGRAPYANPIYAGLITAHTRAKLLDAIRHDPKAVYMVATDGLFCRADALPLEESSDLGGWERKRHDGGMHIVQPGVYFASESDPKTRGVPYSVIVRDEAALRAAWNGNRDDSHTVELRQFLGLRLAAARGKLSQAGQWLPVTKSISYDWSTKRHPGKLRHTPEGFRTVPYDDVAEDESTPYDRTIGGNLARDMERLEFLDAPDWAERLSEI